jgi:predicted dienelactone hydrolase
MVLMATLGALLLAAGTASAQRVIRVPRPDGAETPLAIYQPATAGQGCAPLAVISHGAGGSENGYRCLAGAMAGNGYLTLVMGHKESGLAALRSDIRSDGLRKGIAALVGDPKAESDRLLDVSAALSWAARQCQAPFRVLLGHSMGAETVMLEAGASNNLGITSPPAAANRFDAYVALSPEGPGLVFPSQAWKGIHKPVLVLTGTRDQAVNGGPATRQIPWQQLPGSSGSGCQWLGVIDGATHMNFGGSGLGHERVETLSTATIADFLGGARRSSCPLPTPRSGMALQSK